MTEIRESRLIIHYEGGQIWAEVEELPGCFAAGRTMEELKEALEESISMYLAPSEAERRQVILEFTPEQPRREVRKLPARIELAAA